MHNMCALATTSCRQPVCRLALHRVPSGHDDRPRFADRQLVVTIRYEAATLAKLRHDLMLRGRTLATVLSEVLAGKQPPQLAALLSAKPGMRPEEVVRRALDQVEGRRALLDAGDDRFGRCDVCGIDLGLPVLGEMPWADRCVEHVAQVA